MKHCCKIALLSLALFQFPLLGFGQVLTLEEATKIAVENNFDIKIANNDVEAAQNQVTKGNVGLRPEVDLSAGLFYNASSGYINFTESSPFIDNTYGYNQSTNANAGINVSYLLFDGGRAMTNYQRLGELSQLAQQQVGLTVENVIIQVINAYYNVAQLQENYRIREELLAITKDRIRRAEVKFEYAATSKLEILNAQVDLNTDTVALVNAALQMAQAKRNLNLLLQRPVETAFEIDPEVVFLEELNLDALKEQAIAKNRQLAFSQQNMRIALMDKQAAGAAFKPTVSLGAGYTVNANRNILQNTDFSASGTLGASLNFSHRLVDGGRRKIQHQNAQLNVESSKIAIDQATQQLDLGLENAFANYENSLYVLKIEVDNLEKAQQNFERSREAFNIGQINSTDYRQAQFNLINAQTRIVTARYTAKLAEMELIRLSGGLF